MEENFSIVLLRKFETWRLPALSQASPWAVSNPVSANTDPVPADRLPARRVKVSATFLPTAHFAVAAAHSIEPKEIARDSPSH